MSCLLSFDIITLDLWTEIAPHWMNTIGTLSLSFRVFATAEKEIKLFISKLSLNDIESVS